MQTKTILRTFRLPFLVLTPVCVLLGASIVIASHTAVDDVMIALVLTGAVAAHISINALNEYHDFNSGLDLQTRRTAFSGGSGALPDHPEAVTAVLIAGLLSLLATIAIGGYLIAVTGTSILPIGIAGIVLVASYTQWLNRSPWLCLIAPGTGFGSLMVVGTHLVLTGNVSGPIWLVSLVPFFLINNLLLLNQYPDINADASVGRKTFPIVFGINNSNIVYALFMAAAYATIVLLVANKQIPVTGLVALLPLALSLFALSGAVRYSSKIGEQPRYMAANVAAAVLTPLLLGMAIAAG
jgi:1,4-dihydroxy-2-naphthoate octaprenyltransferase